MSVVVKNMALSHSACTRVGAALVLFLLHSCDCGSGRRAHSGRERPSDRDVVMKPLFWFFKIAVHPVFAALLPML